MNLTNFKAAIDKYGGVARTNLFVVNISNPIGSAAFGTNDLSFFCKSVTIPGMSLDVTEYKPNGFGLTQTVPTGINSDAVDCIFIIDNKYEVLSYFHNWFQKIVNYSTLGGNFSSINDQYPYEIGYKDEYSAATLVIRVYGSGSQDLTAPLYEIILYDAYPKTIGQISMSWDDNNSIATLPVSFSYGKMKLQGETAGSIEERVEEGALNLGTETTSSVVLNRLLDIIR